MLISKYPILCKILLFCWITRETPKNLWIITSPFSRIKLPNCFLRSLQNVTSALDSSVPHERALYVLFPYSSNGLASVWEQPVSRKGRWNHLPGDIGISLQIYLLAWIRCWCPCCSVESTRLNWYWFDSGGDTIWFRESVVCVYLILLRGRDENREIFFLVSIFFSLPYILRIPSHS